MPRSINTLGQALGSGHELIAVCDNIRCRHRRIIDLRKIIEHVGVRHSLTAQRDQKHFSERMLCPACKGRGAFIWMREMAEPEPLLTGLTYQVNDWAVAGGRGLLRVIAKTGNEVVAHAAFESAVGQYPRNHLTLQQRAYVLRDSRVRVIRGGKL